MPHWFILNWTPRPPVIYAQTAIDAGIEVAKQVGDLDKISAIEIATTRRGYEQTGRDPEKWTPDTRDTADHSLPYITARAMFDGDISNDSYAQDKISDPRIRAFMRKMKVSEDPALTARTGPSTVPTRLTAILADRSRVVHEVDDVPGFVGGRWAAPISSANAAAISASAGRASAPMPCSLHCGRSTARTISPPCSASFRTAEPRYGASSVVQPSAP